MATSEVKVFFDPALVKITAVPGSPPVDQTVLIQQLQQDKIALQAQIDTLTARNGVLTTFAQAAIADAQARSDADTAKQEGKNLLDTKPAGL